MLNQIKYKLAEKIKQHPYTQTTIWNLLPRLTFLLPHDKSYLGFRYIAKHANGLFLDIGANNGITAAGFYKLNKNYSILSLEANKWHEPSLKALKSRIDNFDFKIMAAGNKKDQLKLITPFYGNCAIHTHTSTNKDYLATSLKRDFSPKVYNKITYREHSVDVTPVDAMNLNPSIVKIDVEGFDYQVLLGMKETITRCRPYLLIEFTPEHMQNFFEYFAQLNYKMFLYDTEKDKFQEFNLKLATQIWNTNNLQVNIYCVPDEKSSEIPV